jgi:hypothetical protein
MMPVKLKLKIKYKHRKELAEAAEEMRAAADDYFGNKGLILADGSDEADVAYWTKRFYDMVVGDKQDRNMEVIKITYEVAGTWMELTDFSAVPSTNRRERKHHDNLHFSW